jgi:hypothetical protein
LQELRERLDLLDHVCCKEGARCGRAQLAAAESNYLTSRTNFRQIIGVKPPARLVPGSPVDRFFPRTLDASIARSRTEHPTITTAVYNVDVRDNRPFCDGHHIRCVPIRIV